ncbi:hypothetical protein RS407_002522 [Enterobacter hormaechei]|uniref:hypothetical protein n=1 Tax=Enterobacter hormaechei TaxID=158836 RepID=UPI0028C893EF|nr:hypothetical protein [Enterobacter hormaechei]
MSVKRYECGMTNAPTEYQSPTMHKNANGGYVSYEDYAALEARCAALAAELSSVLTDRAVILEDLDNTCFEIGMQRGEKTEAYPTPVVANHDAFLAEVRASAITDALKSLDVVFDTDCVMESNGISYEDAEQRTAGAYAVSKALEEFAAQLRKGVQS